MKKLFIILITLYSYACSAQDGGPKPLNDTIQNIKLKPFNDTIQDVGFKPYTTHFINMDSSRLSRTNHASVLLNQKGFIIMNMETGSIKYQGVMIDTNIMVCRAILDYAAVRDSIKESNIINHGYIVRTPKNIESQASFTYTFSPSEIITRDLFLNIYKNKHTWQYYSNRGYRIVRVKIEQY